jgi:hypothetical protein
VHSSCALLNGLVHASHRHGSVPGLATVSLHPQSKNLYHPETIRKTSSSLVLCVTAGASFYFDVFAHRYVSGLGMEPRVRSKKMGSQELDTAATVSTASHRKAE